MVSRFLKNSIKFFLNKAGYDVCIPNKIPDTIVDKKIKEIIQFVQPYTMTAPLNIYNLILAIKYITENKIEGDIVECGVWKGGSMMAAARALDLYQENSKKLFLYDTFEGMSTPTKEDVCTWGSLASEKMKKENKRDSSSVWCVSPLEEVKENMYKTNFDKNKIEFVKGKVENTLNLDTIPKNISLLRLDTDWYESTKVELEKLWPRLTVGGIIIIDDYGHWKGSRKAVDEYFNKVKCVPFIDIGGPLVGVKVKS